MGCVCKHIKGYDEMKKLPDWVGSDDPYKDGWPAALFGVRSTNGAEGVNNALILNESRNCLPFESLNIVLENWSDKEVERAVLCRNLSSIDGDFIDSTKKIINKQIELSRTYECKIMAMTLNEVSQLIVTRGTSKNRYVIDLLKHRCSCTFFQQLLLPCCHIFSAKAFCAREKYHFPDLSNYSHSTYLRERFILSHSTTSIFLPTTDYIKIRDIKAPAYRKSAGRPRKKARVKSKSEVSSLSLPKSTYYCSRCKEYGHNKRTCRVVNPGMTTENSDNSSYGSTYVGSDISLFSSEIFKGVTAFNAEEFKSVLECYSFESQNFSNESFPIKYGNSFEIEALSVASESFSIHDVDSIVDEGS